MYQWYSLSKVCYAHLADVPTGTNPRALWSAFHESQWFRHGWALQELIAPLNVTFLSDDWTAVGTKATLGRVIEEITGIPTEALVHAEPLDNFSVA